MDTITLSTLQYIKSGRLSLDMVIVFHLGGFGRRMFGRYSWNTSP